MNLAHLHLLLNHFPTVGMVVGVGLFLFAVLRRNDDLQHISLVVLFLLALISIPVFLTGGAAKQMLANRPEVSVAVIDRHLDAAIVAFIFVELTGFLAWLGLWRWRATSRPARWNIWAVLALSAVTLALMARAANIGGEIRHPEIGASSASATAALWGTNWLSSRSIIEFSTDTWVWPTLETIHFIGMALLFGVVLTVNLRVLGLMKGVSLAALHRLLPWAALGLAANTTTGTLFFIITPEQYTQNTPFHWKIVLLMLAALSLLYLMIADETWKVESGADASWSAKVIALSGMVAWLGVMYCGRMLPYLGNADQLQDQVSMPLGLSVSLAVVATVIVLAVVGYLIDRMAS